MNGKTLFAGKEVSVELEDYRVKCAVDITGQGGATCFLQEDPFLHWPVPDPQNIMEFLCMENHEMEPVGWEKRYCKSILSLQACIDFVRVPIAMASARES